MSYDHTAYDKLLKAATNYICDQDNKCDVYENMYMSIQNIAQHIEDAFNAVKMQKVYINDLAVQNVRMAIFRSYYAMFFNHFSGDEYTELENDLLVFIATDRALIEHVEYAEDTLKVYTDLSYIVWGNVDMEERMNTYKEMITRCRTKEKAELIVMFMKFVGNEIARISA